MWQISKNAVCVSRHVKNNVTVVSVPGQHPICCATNCSFSVLHEYGCWVESSGYLTTPLTRTLNHKNVLALSIHKFCSVSLYFFHIDCRLLDCPRAVVEFHARGKNNAVQAPHSEPSNLIFTAPQRFLRNELRVRALRIPPLCLSVVLSHGGSNPVCLCGNCSHPQRLSGEVRRPELELNSNQENPWRARMRESEPCVVLMLV